VLGGGFAQKEAAMGSFDAFINVLTVLTVLSVASERVTNVVKLRRHPKREGEDQDPQREYLITWTNVGIGAALALLMKADLFAMLAHADSPWGTLGWTEWDGTKWVRTAALHDVAGAAQAVLGSVITGVSLGFGSKFWHDVLGIVVEMRALVQSKTVPQPQPTVAQVTATVKTPGDTQAAAIVVQQGAPHAAE
jgi:hypothetical protein